MKRSLQDDMERGYKQIGDRYICYIMNLENPQLFNDLVEHLRDFQGDLNYLDKEVFKRAHVIIEEAEQWEKLISNPIYLAKQIVSSYQGFPSFQEFLTHHNAMVEKTDSKTLIDTKEGQHVVYLRMKGDVLTSLTLNIHELCHLEESYKNQKHFGEIIESSKKLNSFIRSTEIDLNHCLENLPDAWSVIKTWKDSSPFLEISKRRNPFHFFDIPKFQTKAQTRFLRFSTEEIDKLRVERLKWDILGWISEGIAYRETENAFMNCSLFNEDVKLLTGINATLTSLGAATFKGLKEEDLNELNAGIKIRGLSYRPKYHIGIGFVDFWGKCENYWQNREKTFLNDLLTDPVNNLEIFGKKYVISEIRSIEKTLEIR